MRRRFRPVRRGCLGALLAIVVSGLLLATSARALPLDEDTPEIKQGLIHDRTFIEPLKDHDRDGTLRQLARSIGLLRVAFANESVKSCTGWLISRDEIVTNHHCVDGPIDSIDIVFDFLDLETRSVRLEVDPIVRRSNPDIDYAILRLQSPVENRNPLPVSARAPEAGEPLFVIHHPAYLPLQVSRRSCRSEGTEDFTLRHSCNTLEGSSGAPVFRGGSVVALHRARNEKSTYNLASLLAALPDLGGYVASAADPLPPPSFPESASSQRIEAYVPRQGSSKKRVLFVIEPSASFSQRAKEVATEAAALVSDWIGPDSDLEAVVLPAATYSASEKYLEGQPFNPSSYDPKPFFEGDEWSFDSFDSKFLKEGGTSVARTRVRFLAGLERRAAGMSRSYPSRAVDKTAILIAFLRWISRAGERTLFSDQGLVRPESTDLIVFIAGSPDRCTRAGPNVESPCDFSNSGVIDVFLESASFLGRHDPGNPATFIAITPSLDDRLGSVLREAAIHPAVFAFHVSIDDPRRAERLGEIKSFLDDLFRDRYLKLTRETAAGIGDGPVAVEIEGQPFTGDHRVIRWTDPPQAAVRLERAPDFARNRPSHRILIRERGAAIEPGAPDS